MGALLRGREVGSFYMKNKFDWLNLLWEGGELGRFGHFLNFESTPYETKLNNVYCSPQFNLIPMWVQTPTPYALYFKCLILAHQHFQAIISKDELT